MNESGWPRTAAELLALPELALETYLRGREVRAAYPEGTCTHARDGGGSVWRCVLLEGVPDVRRVKL